MSMESSAGMSWSESDLDSGIQQKNVGAVGLSSVDSRSAIVHAVVVATAIWEARWWCGQFDSVQRNRVENYDLLSQQTRNLLGSTPTCRIGSTRLLLSKKSGIAWLPCVPSTRNHRALLNFLDADVELTIDR